MPEQFLYCTDILPRFKEESSEITEKIDEAKKAITTTPARIIANSKKKTDKNWTMPGVKKVK